MHSRKRRFSRRPVKVRRGAALVELAICLPLLVFLIGATVEACDLIFLRNALATASYSGTLEISRPGCTEQSIRSQMTQVLDSAKVKGYTISVTGSGGRSFSSTIKGDLISVQVSALSSNNLRIGKFIPTAAKDIIVNAIAIR
jgi:Flp pilus assembly protein TadG